MIHEMVDLITINEKKNASTAEFEGNFNNLRKKKRDNLMVKFMVSSWHGEM